MPKKENTLKENTTVLFPPLYHDTILSRKSGTKRSYFIFFKALVYSSLHQRSVILTLNEI